MTSWNVCLRSDYSHLVSTYLAVIRRFTLKADEQDVVVCLWGSMEKISWSRNVSTLVSDEKVTEGHTGQKKWSYKDVADSISNGSFIKTTSGSGKTRRSDVKHLIKQETRVNTHQATLCRPFQRHNGALR